MMVITLFFSSLLVAGSSAANSDVRSPTRSLREAATRRQEVSEATQQCFIDSLNLVKNSPSLQEASVELAKDYISALTACATDGGLQTGCDIDFGDFASTSEYTLACADAGGVIYDTSLEYGCTGAIFDQEVDFSFSYENNPTCLFETCNIDQIEEFLDSASSTFSEGIESVADLVSGSDSTLDCNADFSYVNSNGVSLAELRENEAAASENEAAAPSSSAYTQRSMTLGQAISATLGVATASFYMM